MNYPYLSYYNTTGQWASYNVSCLNYLTTQQKCTICSQRLSLCASSEPTLDHITKQQIGAFMY